METRIITDQIDQLIEIISKNTLCYSFTKKKKKLNDSELNMYPFFLFVLAQKIVQVRQKSKEISRAKSTYSTKISKKIFVLTCQ